MDRKRIALNSSIKWSEGLPEYVLDQILNFCGLRDSIRMGSACKSWLSVFKWNTSRRLQLPWLMMTSNPNCKSAEEEEGPEGRCFFSLSDNTIYTIKVPEIRGRLCCASFNNGWLMTLEPNLFDIRFFHTSLFHLSERIQLQLPKLFIDSYFDVSLERPRRQFQTPPIRKAAMSDDDAAVVAIIDARSQFAFCRTGKDKVWNSVYGLNRCFADIIYYKGRFYGIDLFTDDVAVIYINNNNATYTQIICVTRGWEGRRGFRDQTYLVADPTSESLFIVNRSIRWHSVQSEVVLLGTPRTHGFEVWELGLEESTRKKEYTPVRVESLGDRAMFLGQNSSMIVMASQFSGFKGNCIYFTDDYFSPFNLERLPIGCADNGIFNMEDRTTSQLFSDRAHDSPFSLPIWITLPSYSGKRVKPYQINHPRRVIARQDEG